MNLNGQDWNDIVLRKKPATSAAKTSSSAVNAAIRAGAFLFLTVTIITFSNKTFQKKPKIVPVFVCVGASVETSKKQTAGTNKNAAHGAVKNLAKLENETEVFEHERVSTELKKQIQQGRIAKKLTQAQLAQLINEKPQIINEYENGKAIPNPQVSDSYEVLFIACMME